MFCCESGGFGPMITVIEDPGSRPRLNDARCGVTQLDRPLGGRGPIQSDVRTVFV